MKVLFLDIDGVLNSTRSIVAYGGAPSLATIDGPRGLGGFDDVAVRLVAGIVAAAGAQIVLSSSWRTYEGWQKIGPALGLPIIDRTPMLLGPRGREIAAWLAGRPEVERYAIVDDDPDMLPEHLPFFVRTMEQEGLTFGAASALATLLGVSIYDANRTGQAPVTHALDWSDA